MKLRLANLWDRRQSRDDLEQEADEELARVAAGGREPVDTTERVADSGDADMAPAAGGDIDMSEPAAGATEPQQSTVEGEAPPDPIQDWHDRMAQVRRGGR